MKNIVIIMIIAFIVAGGIIYAIRPRNDSITVKPMNPTSQVIINHQNNSGVIIVAPTGSIKLSETSKTPVNIFDKYVEKYLGQSIAYSVKDNKTTYYLPNRDYSIISYAVVNVLNAYSDADKYYTIIGDPNTGIKNLNYCNKYQTDVVKFVNECGNDLNFFEAYAFGNFQTPFTMIIVINPVTNHIAYVFGDKVYDVFNTYKYQDYVKRVMYKYDPTVAYIIVFDRNTYSMSPIPLITGAHRADIEATGIINDKPVTIVMRNDYFILNWGTVNMTRDGTAFIYNNAMLDYYPINYTKIEPIDPVIANATDTNYMYIMGTTYTLIPTMNITDSNITIVAYEVLNGPSVGNITVTYYN